MGVAATVGVLVGVFVGVFVGVSVGVAVCPDTDPSGNKTNKASMKRYLLFIALSFPVRTNSVHFRDTLHLLALRQDFYRVLVRHIQRSGCEFFQDVSNLG
jgi:hypothetical protein